MREEIRRRLQAWMTERIGQFRDEQNLTQEQMSEMLMMSPRSYRDLEHGVTGCSLQTFLQFQRCLPREEAHRLLEDYEKLRENAENHEGPDE